MIEPIIAIGIVIISLVALFVGLTLGFASSSLSSVAVLGLGLVLGSALWITSLLFSGDLGLIPFLTDLAGLLTSLRIGTFIFGSAVLTTVVILIAVLEIGYYSGYASGRLRMRENELALSTKDQESAQLAPVFQAPASSAPVAKSASVSPPAQPATPRKKFQALNAATYSLRPSRNQQTAVQPLTEDEKSLATVLVTERINEVAPTISDSYPEGYNYEQLASLGWDSAKIAAALDSLSNKKYLLKTPSEKILHCRQCGSSSLQFTSVCPECKSVHLSKHRVLEHFSCGYVDKEEKFRSAFDSELMCPKCNKRLEVMGSDYRSLGLMYVCQDCGALNKDLLSILKCKKCGFTAPPDLEDEEYVYSFKINQSTLPRLASLVKPTESISRYFKPIGYSVFSPASIRGKSGMDHKFDLLVIGYSRGGNGDHPQREPKRFAIDVLTSDSVVGSDAISREYSKISDLSYPSIVIAVPKLSEDAKKFVTSHSINVLEVQNSEDTVPRIKEFLVRPWSSSIPAHTEVPSSSPSS